jgi:hypothetical protein
MRIRLFAVAAVPAIALALPSVPAASAANTPTFRDCSLLVSGIDPDFVELIGARVSSEGTLSVPPKQTHVNVKASESSDPGDSEGHVTLELTITAPGVRTRTVTGAGTGQVELEAPLRRRIVGRQYTISWAATFDNGNHLCPSENTPENTSPNPFVVGIART